MSEVLQTGSLEREELIARAAAALRSGELVVLPTDTVYGLAADAFSPAGTQHVFSAKGRDRTLPLPVLIRSPKQLLGLVTEVPSSAERLMAAYWPGPLTIVVRHDPNLVWDLGHNEGTVAVRMPLDELALDVIRAIGPLAVTSANRSGNAPATTIDTALEEFGDAVAVYLDDGPRATLAPSAVVDLTRSEPALLRPGPLDPDEVLAVARGEHDPFDPRPSHDG